jgi:hypothetical protein
MNPNRRSPTAVILFILLLSVSNRYNLIQSFKFQTGKKHVKIQLILVFAVIFSAIGPALPSNFGALEKTAGGAKCAILKQTTAFRQAKAVFAGEVIGEEKNGDRRSFEFAVEEYWKGDGRKKITIDVFETPRFQAHFKKGEKYLIYANAAFDEKGNLRVERCSRSRERGQAADDLKQLGKGKKPQ